MQKSLQAVCVVSEKVVPLQRVLGTSTLTICLCMVEWLCGVGINKVHGDDPASRVRIFEDR